MLGCGAMPLQDYTLLHLTSCCSLRQFQIERNVKLNEDIVVKSEVKLVITLERVLNNMAERLNLLIASFYYSDPLVCNW